MKARKVLLLLGLMCAMALLCTACATTALDNINTYYAEVGAVMDDWFGGSSGGGVSGGGEGAVAALDAPGSFTLDADGNYSFTGVADADYYLVYFCAPDATGDSDPFLFSSSSIDAVGTGGEVYEGNVDDLVRYGYGEYLVKVFAFPNLNDSTHAMATAATSGRRSAAPRPAPPPPAPRSAAPRSAASPPPAAIAALCSVTVRPRKGLVPQPGGGGAVGDGAMGH